MNIQGKLHAIMEVQQVTDTFRKREFVVEFADNPMYPQYILFQMVQDRVDLIEPYAVGQMVDVSFNMRGRQWNSPQGEIRYFNSLEAWRISPVQPGQIPQGQPQGTVTGQQMQQPQQPQTQMQRQKAAPGMMDVTALDADDDLPF